MKYSDFFNNLDLNVDYVETIKEFNDMKTCKHSTHWHNEGSPWDHTMLVVKNMKEFLSHDYTLVQYDIDNWHMEALMMAALFHDIAKPAVTEWDEKKQDWGCPNHAEVGSKMTRELLFDWDDICQREYIVGLVRHHMILHHILEQNDQNKYKKFFKFGGRHYTNINYKHQCLLCMCDDLSSWCKDTCVAEKIYAHKKILMLENIPINGNHAVRSAQNEVFINARKTFYGKGEYEDNPINVYIMIGLPGSGKSTWVSNNHPNIPLVSRDLARVELGYCSIGEKYLGTESEENNVTKCVENKMLSLAKDGVDFIIDNTHLKQKYRDKIHVLLKDYNIKYTYVYVEGPTLNEIIKRRKDDGFGFKSESIILNMLKTFEFPYRYEYDDLLIIKQK